MKIRREFMDRFVIFYTYEGEVKSIIISANNKTDALKAMDYYDIFDIFYHDDIAKEDVKELKDFYKNNKHRYFYGLKRIHG